MGCFSPLVSSVLYIHIVEMARTQPDAYNLLEKLSAVEEALQSLRPWLQDTADNLNSRILCYVFCVC